MAARPPREGPRDRKAPLSWDDCVLPLPKQTVARLQKRPTTDGDNVGLWLDKLVWRSRRSHDLASELRAFSLTQLCQQYGSTAGAQAALRLRETAAVLHGPARVRTFRADVDGRLLVGYGRANAVETALTFHRSWGVPIVPGSALKGIARARAACDGVLDAAAVDRIFGVQDHRGRVVFYDAIPDKGQFTIGLDVLTPHMRDYYEGKAPPADWLSPQPFTFLTVVRASFVFIIGADLQDGEATEQSAKSDLESATAVLKQALEEDGVGAKTAAGYGRFRSFQGL